MMNVAFQFPFEDSELLEDVAAMARDYIRYVISCVKNISQEAMLPAPHPVMNSTVVNPAMGFNSMNSASSFAFNLAILMCQSYRQVKEMFISLSL